jgi:alpha,alpha-trehalase
MLDRAKKLNPFRRSNDLKAEDVVAARAYIKAYWQKLERFHPKDDESLLGLPNKYLVPAFEEGHEFDFNEMYYWDSYFMAQGIMEREHKELVVGMLDNLLYMFKRFKVVPNASRMYLMGRSQPPFLTSYIWDVFDAYELDEKWLKDAIETAEAEYKTVWMGESKPNARLVYQGLSRYYDINYLNDLAEAESGWDMTTRFGRKALNFVPTDLNALLYKYEMDFARYYRHIKDARGAAKWEVAAKARAETMNKLMWSNLRGLYYDYNFVKERRGTVSSLAGLYPLWAGMADQKQAAQMVKAIRRFEQRGGLASTDGQVVQQIVPGVVMPGALPVQWAFPNGWAPLHFLVIKGLLKYGYHEDARRIAMKWLRNNLNWFNEHGVFLEKYNVVSPGKPPAKGVYPSLTGFGWTNSVFEYLCKEFIDER